MRVGTSLPSASQSVAVGSFAALVLFLTLHAFADALAASPRTIVLAGFLGALVFFFAFVAWANVRGSAGWFDVALAELIALAASAAVHRIAVTTCVLFSGAALYYIHHVSESVHASSRAPSATGKKKN